jgi:hypothetical protein
VDFPEFEQIVRNSLPIKDEKILFYNAASWLPHIYGYSEMFKMIGTLSNDGVLVCTENSLYFVVWSKDNQRYIPGLKVDYEDLTEVVVKKWGLGRRLVISDKNFSFHSFEIGGAIIDQEKTQEAYELLYGRLKKNQD